MYTWPTGILKACAQLFMALNLKYLFILRQSTSGDLFPCELSPALLRSCLESKPIGYRRIYCRVNPISILLALAFMRCRASRTKTPTTFA